MYRLKRDALSMVKMKGRGVSAKPLLHIIESSDDLQKVPTIERLLVPKNETPDAVVEDRSPFRIPSPDLLVACDDHPALTACLSQPYLVRRVVREPRLQPFDIITHARECICDVTRDGAIDEDHAGVREASNWIACSTSSSVILKL